MTIQLIGFIAMLTGLVSVQFKYRSHILYTQLISNVLWATHFILLGATTGAAMNVIGGIRAYTFNRFGSGVVRSPWLPAVIILLFAGATIVTWQGMISLLPFLGMTIATFGFWHRNEQTIRIILLSAAPFWLTYDALSGSIAGTINEMFAIVSISISLWRYRDNKPANVIVPNQIEPEKAVVSNNLR